MALLNAPDCTELGDLIVGDQLFRRFTVRDKDGVPTPSTVVSTLTEPDGSVVDLVVTPESVGVYLVTIPPFDARGWYTLRTAAQGPVYAAERLRLHVGP